MYTINPQTKDPLREPLFADYIVNKKTRPLRKRPGLLIYSTGSNISWGAPHTGQISGGSGPSWIYPHTRHFQRL